MSTFDKEKCFMSGTRISAALEASNKKYEEFLALEKKKKEELKAQRDLAQLAKLAEQKEAAPKVIEPPVNAPQAAAAGAGAPVVTAGYSSILSYLPFVGSYFAAAPATVTTQPEVAVRPSAGLN